MPQKDIFSKVGKTQILMSLTPISQFRGSENYKLKFTKWPLHEILSPTFSLYRIICNQATKSIGRNFETAKCYQSVKTKIQSKLATLNYMRVNKSALCTEAEKYVYDSFLKINLFSTDK